MKIQKIIKIDLNKSAFAYPVRVVQYDTGIQLVLTLTDFEIPDGTTAIVYFMKPSGKFVYQEDNISISDNTITIDVHNQAFTEHGKVKYQVELTNGSDIITTFSRMVEVEKSLSNSGGDKSTTVIRAFEELTAEKIAEIEAHTEALIASATEEILNSIPDEYTEMSNKVDYLYDNVANAIKKVVSGKNVMVTDVSKVEHEINIFVHGKNVFDKATIASKRTDSEIGYRTYLLTLPNGKYTWSLQENTFFGSGCYAIWTDDILYNGSDHRNGYTYQWIGNSGVERECPLTGTFEVTKGYIYIGTTGAVNGTIDEFIDKFDTLQLEQGETVTAYESYLDPTSATVTIDGVNYTPSANGTIDGIMSTVLTNGISTATSGFTIDCEYNMDSNVVINKLINAIVALGGSV